MARSAAGSSMPARNCATATIQIACEFVKSHSAGTNVPSSVKTRITALLP